MSVMRTLVLAGLASIISAYTPPTNATWGALLTPDLTHPVTQGQSFTVTWDPTGHSTDGVTVSLVLCNGPSTNCVPQKSAIVEGVPAGQKSYNWAVPCSLTPGVQATDTGYGMLIIVDGTGEFQYSTQFSVLANPTCAAVSSSSVSSSASSSVSSGASTSQSSAPAPAPNPSNTWEYWSSSASASAAAASSSASSVPAKNSASTMITSAAPVTSTAMMTTHAPVPTSAITSAAASASSSKPVSTFTGAAPQITSGAIGVVAAAAFAVFAL